MQGIQKTSVVGGETVDVACKNRDRSSWADSRLERISLTAPVTLATFSLLVERNLSSLVVMVDDSATIRKIFEVCLHRAGYQVKTFSDAVEVFDWFRSSEASAPVLVFVDVCLPNMDGYTLIQRLRTKPAFAHTVFVMMSSHCGVLDRLKGRLAGASVYLTKPTRTQEIVRVVQEQLGSALSEDRDTRPKQEAERLAMYEGYR